MKTNQSFFCRQHFFCNFSLTTLVTQSKFHVDDKKLLMTKSCRLHSASFVNSLTLSHSCQEKFSIIPVGSFEQLVEWGQETFDSWKRGGINFSSSRSCYHCTMTCLQNYIASKTNHCSKSFVKNISFLLYWIHKFKMWTYWIKLDSNLNFTGPLMLYLQTEAVLKVVFLTERCLNETLFPEMYSMIETVLGEHFEIDKLS